MTHWREVTFAEPEGNGTVVWCRRTDWVTVKAAEAVRDGFDGEQYMCEGYEFTKFAYIDHPDTIPDHHPWYELILMESGGPAEHEMLQKTIGERAESYEVFCNSNAAYYSGQIDSHRKWMCDNNYHFLFKTREDRLLAEIALAGKRA